MKHSTDLHSHSRNFVVFGTNCGIITSHTKLKKLLLFTVANNGTDQRFHTHSKLSSFFRLLVISNTEAMSEERRTQSSPSMTRDTSLTIYTRPTATASCVPADDDDAEKGLRTDITTGLQRGFGAPLHRETPEPPRCNELNGRVMGHIALALL